jgi:RimJ/RimL family protein N-acetyltransferase/ketosteroid isomerase-like protein
MNWGRPEEIAALDALRREFERAENAGDADAIASLLRDDAVFMVPHVPPQEGKTAAVALLREVLADFVAYFDRHIAYTSDEIHAGAEWAFDRGTFVVDIRKKTSVTSEQFGGKYFLTYARDDADEWKLARAIVSLDQEPEREGPDSEPKAPERIETARLVLRRPRSEDIEAIFTRFAADPDVTRYVGWLRHTSLAATEGFINFSDDEWTRGGAGPYLIESRETGVLLGCTGISVETPFRASTGYVLAKDAWGQGFAMEALGATVEVARAMGIARLYAIVHPDHSASIRVLEKGGFEREALLARHTVFPNLSPTPVDVWIYTHTGGTDGVRSGIAPSTVGR